MTSEIPLLSPKPFAAYSPAEYKAYVESLYVEPPKPPPKAEFKATLNKKGNPVITVRRNPKWLLAAEVLALASQVGWSYQNMWCHLVSKKIEIRRG